MEEEIKEEILRLYGSKGVTVSEVTIKNKISDFLKRNVENANQSLRYVAVVVIPGKVVKINHSIRVTIRNVKDVERAVDEMLKRWNIKL